jgi:hypothetical protein
MTCRWDLTDGQPQLAVASRISMALWTLHESGPSPFDYVLAASFGEPEKQIDRIAHASDGTGSWLEGVAGSGRFLAYSWADDEYVDKLGCLSGGSCKRTIAGGGINIVTQTGPRQLTKTPALQLAAAAGRIAYIPATRVPANRPAASTNSAIDVIDAGTGEPVFPDNPTVGGVPAAIALSPHVLAVLAQKGPRDRISWFSATTGTKINSVLVSSRAAPQLAASDKLLVYRVYRNLYGVSTATGRVRPLGKMPQNTVTVGPTVGKGQLVWAENRGTSGRLRALAAS